MISLSAVVTVLVYLIVAGLVFWLLYWLVCFVGLIFTVPYAYSVIAGVVRYYEQQLSGPTQPNIPTSV